MQFFSGPPCSFGLIDHLAYTVDLSAARHRHGLFVLFINQAVSRLFHRCNLIRPIRDSVIFIAGFYAPPCSFGLIGHLVYTVVLSAARHRHGLLVYCSGCMKLICFAIMV